MNIYCCGCEKEVEPKLVHGDVIYPHRSDLAELPFWKCNDCGNFVGCHHKTNNPTHPLGCIPTKGIKNARQHIHRILDPLWQSKRYKRGQLYSMIAEHLGRKKYHTADIRSVEEARQVYVFVRNLTT